MESSGSQFERSADISRLHEIQQEIHQSAENKETFLRPVIKVPSQSDNRQTIISLQKRIAQLEGKLAKLESREVQLPKKKKKIRRKAKEVPRIFQCSFSNCGKQYGSEASLRNHKKLKHGIRLFRASKYRSNPRGQQQRKDDII